MPQTTAKAAVSSRPGTFLAVCLGCVLSAATPALAVDDGGSPSPAAKGLGQVDSVLDRLEKRLLDQEADGLSYGERQNDPAFLKHPEDVPARSYRVDGGKIEAARPEVDRLKSVSTLVSELESQVDQLSSNVQKTKQAIVDEADIDNFVSLEASLEHTDLAAIKTMTVKLDGYDVYSLAEASGLWMPSKALPLYSGPLQPGSHRVDLEARLVLRDGPDLPLNGEVYRFINKSFDLLVPGARSSVRYVISIKPPEKIGGVADAVLKEAR